MPSHNRENGSWTATTTITECRGKSSPVLVLCVTAVHYRGYGRVERRRRNGWKNCKETGNPYASHRRSWTIYRPVRNPNDQPHQELPEIPPQYTDNGNNNGQRSSQFHTHKIIALLSFYPSRTLTIICWWYFVIISHDSWTHCYLFHSLYHPVCISSHLLLHNKYASLPLLYSLPLILFCTLEPKPRPHSGLRDEGRGTCTS